MLKEDCFTASIEFGPNTSHQCGFARPGCTTNEEERGQCTVTLSNLQYFFLYVAFTIALALNVLPCRLTSVIESGTLVGLPLKGIGRHQFKRLLTIRRKTMPLDFFVPAHPMS